MATYTKKNRIVKFLIEGDADPIELTGDAANAALGQFKAHKDIDVKFEDNGATVELYVPYGNIMYFAEGFGEDESVNRPDAYGCEGGSKGAVWYRGTFGECQGNMAIAEGNVTDDADINAMLTNPSDYNVYLNGLQLPLIQIIDEDEGKAATYGVDTETEERVVTLGIVDGNILTEIVVECPPPTDAIVTVAHK